MFMTLTGERRWQHLRRSAVDFYSKKRKNRSLSHSFGHLGVTYTLHLWLVGKPVIDSILSWLNFFSISYGWDVISGNRSKSAFFEGGGPLWTQISEGRGVAHKPLLLSEYRVIALSCGIKISAVRHLVLSQCTRVTDGRTDRRTELRLPDCPCICLRGKNKCSSLIFCSVLCIHITHRRSW